MKSAIGIVLGVSVLLAIGWGIIATWWMGLLLGVPLCVAAQAGSRPVRNAYTLIRPILLLLAVMAGCAVIAGAIGLLLAKYGLVWLEKSLYSEVPRDRYALFIADLWAHSASYLVGFVGGIILAVRVWRSRTVTQPPGVRAPRTEIRPP